MTESSPAAMVLWRLDIFAFLQARLSLCSSTMRSVLIFHVLFHLLQRRFRWYYVKIAQPFVGQDGAHSANGHLNVRPLNLLIYHL